MRRQPRFKVVAWVASPNIGPSMNRHPFVHTAVLECGHEHNVGISQERPKRMACYYSHAPKAALR